MSRLILTAIIILLSIGVFGQEWSKVYNDSIIHVLDNYLISANKAYKFNGSILIAQKGQVLLHKAYGWRNVSTHALNDTNTRFPILSITKSFTATIILKLQEEGKLSVKDKLSKYFPDYKYGDKVTIENLLTHSSGIHNYSDEVGEEDSAIVNHPIPKERIIETFYTKPLEFTPGKEFSYNNSGYFLLGLIIEKVTSKPYEQVVREQIFAPLGMDHSGFDYNDLPDSIKAQGYNILNEEQQRLYKHYDSTYAYSAGAIYSTTGDLYKFAQVIAAKRILSPDSWEMAFQPRINQYGYGWKIGNFFGRNYIRHDGGYPGFMSDLIYYPKEDITVIILNNFGNYGENVWASAMGISSILFHLPYDLWKPRNEIKADSNSLKQYVGLYRLNKKFGISVTLNNGQLYVKGEGQSQLPELPILCEAENKFYLKDFNTTLTFIKDSNNTISRILIHEHGTDTEWQKVK